MTRAASRRDLLGAGIFTGLAGIAVATIARPEQLDGSAGAGPHAEPDAELIALCSRFDELERRCLAQHDREAAEIVAARSRRATRAELVAIGKRGNTEREPWEEAQDELFERIVAIPATTLAGVRAVAATWRLWDARMEPDGQAHGYKNHRIAWPLVRSLTELPA